MIFPSIILKIERWKFNKDYGVYVSTLGNFKDRYKRNLPINVTNKGYCTVKTEAAGEWPKAHRLVMLTWKPIPNAENLTVDHLNHNKRDNSLVNLEWVTQEENLRRAERDYIVVDKKGKIKKEGNKKVISIFSPKVSVAEYRSHLMGYEINGKKCLIAEDMFEEVRRHYQKMTDEELLNRIKNIIRRFETRHNVSPTGIKICNGLVIVPIYDKTVILR
jgi:hypothetical protein